MDDISTFLDKIIQVAGSLKPKDTATRFSNVEKLASSLKLFMPPVKSITEAVRKSTAKKAAAC